MIWIEKRIQDLTAIEMLEILSARSEVFVVEQRCIYNDPDERDAGAIHLYCRDGFGVSAYARILEPNTRFSEPSIGRVLTVQRVRSTGLGKELMREALVRARHHFGNRMLRISAQLYLLRFYENLGFIRASEQYDEDGIPHIEMTVDL